MTLGKHTNKHVKMIRYTCSKLFRTRITINYFVKLKKAPIIDELLSVGMVRSFDEKRYH